MKTIVIYILSALFLVLCRERSSAAPVNTTQPTNASSTDKTTEIPDKVKSAIATLLDNSNNQETLAKAVIMLDSFEKGKLDGLVKTIEDNQTGERWAECAYIYPKLGVRIHYVSGKINAVQWKKKHCYHLQDRPDKKEKSNE